MKFDIFFSISQTPVAGRMPSEREMFQSFFEQVEAAGGKTVTSRTEIPGMGAFAYFEDPEGNVMGLWETTT